MEIDRTSKEPLYRQIVRHFENRISQGDIPPGTALPPERKLANQLGVNRSTITAAYEELRASGMVQSVQGRGTVVSDHLWGVHPSRLPNWNQYLNEGSFLPARPLVKRIREESDDFRIINLAGAELAADLLPTKTLNELLRGISLASPPTYPDPKGEPALRQTLSIHLKEQYGIRTDPKQILVTSGAQQALHLITQCLLSPGDAVAMEGPSYAYSLPLFISAGLRLFRLPLDEQGLLPDEVRTLFLKHRIRMVFANPTYQNPTGTTLPLARRKKLLQICEELRIPIVEDDAYGAITLQGSPPPPPPLIALTERGGLVIYVGSLSKTVAPGLRIGWLVAPQSVVERLADARQQMDFGTSPILQQLVSEYLSGHWNAHIDVIKNELSRRRDHMIQALERHMGKEASWVVPQGSYHIWCRLQRKVPETELLEAGIKNGVLFVPGGVFGAERGFVRITYARAKANEIGEGIKRFAKMLQK